MKSRGSAKRRGSRQDADGNNLLPPVSVAPPPAALEEQYHFAEFKAWGRQRPPGHRLGDKRIGFSAGPDNSPGTASVEPAADSAPSG